MIDLEHAVTPSYMSGAIALAGLLKALPPDEAAAWRLGEVEALLWEHAEAHARCYGQPVVWFVEPGMRPFAYSSRGGWLLHVMNGVAAKLGASMMSRGKWEATRPPSGWPQRLLDEVNAAVALGDVVVPPLGSVWALFPAPWRRWRLSEVYASGDGAAWWLGLVEDGTDNAKKVLWTQLVSCLYVPAGARPFAAWCRRPPMEDRT